MNWPLVVSDKFIDNKKDYWATGNIENASGFQSIKIQNGVYHWEMKAKTSSYPWQNIHYTTGNIFYLSSKVNKISGSGNYGLCFFSRVRNNNALKERSIFYYFIINDNKTFSFGINDLTFSYSGTVIFLKNDEKIIDWTHSVAINTDKPNKITIISNKSDFYFYINDEFVAKAKDPGLYTGDCGVVCNLLKKNDNLIVDYSDFEIRKP